MVPSGAQAGPLGPVCLAGCLGTCSATVCKHAIAIALVETAATGLVLAPAAFLKAGIKCKICKAACFVVCGHSCFAEGTKVTLLESDTKVDKNIESVQAGDTVLTLVGGKPAWTKVTRNLKIEGDFEFVRITTQDLKSGLQKRITVTPEHGLVTINENGELTLDAAKHLLVGDRMRAADGEELSVVDVSQVRLSEKYALETTDGTVLASDVFVSTICDEEVSAGEQLFNEKMKDWCKRHNCSN